MTSARGGPCVATAVTLQLAAKSVLLTASPVAPATNLCCRRHFFARHQVLIRKARGIIFNPNLSPRSSSSIPAAPRSLRAAIICATCLLLAFFLPISNFTSYTYFQKPGPGRFKKGIIIVSGFAAFKLLEVLFIFFSLFQTETTFFFHFSPSTDAFKGSGLIDNRWY